MTDKTKTICSPIFHLGGINFTSNSYNSVMKLDTQEKKDYKAKLEHGDEMRAKAIIKQLP